MSKKIHRLFKLKKIIISGKEIDVAFKEVKPMVFWKEKEIIKQQLNIWNLDQLQALLYKLNKIELLCKKNNDIAVNIILDFMSNISLKINNFS